MIELFFDLDGGEFVGRFHVRCFDYAGCGSKFVGVGDVLVIDLVEHGFS